MKVAVIGAGVFGRAIAHTLLTNNNEVNFWTKIDNEVGEINKSFGNKFKKKFSIYSNIKNTIKKCQVIFIAVSSQYVYDVLEELKDYIETSQGICILSKGFENHTNNFITEYINDVLPGYSCAVLSGPSFAEDIISEKNVNVDIASKDINLSNTIVSILQNNYLSVIRTNDIIGTEVCSICKNILAINMGILSGMKLSPSTQAAFFTVALNSIHKLIIHYGGEYNTILSMAGIGDTFLTCTSTNSRNYSLGVLVGEGNKLAIDNFKKNNTIEGLTSLGILYNKLKEENYNIDWINKLYSVLYNNKDANTLIELITQ